MKFLVHIEQYNVLGILPSQIESLALLKSAMGFEDGAYIDNTLDGFRVRGGLRRFNSLKKFLSQEKGPFVVFCPNEGEDFRKVTIPKDSWLIFGPSMGFKKESFDGVEVIWAKVPGGAINSRDIVPITLWEQSVWQEQ